MSRELITIGISHHTAPLHVRESLAIGSDELFGTLHALRENPSLQDLVLLSTCNRTEFYIGSDDAGSAEKFARAYFIERLADQSAGNELYVHRGSEAVRHLFRVAGSLDSMVVGENQILAQVREAFETANQQNRLSTILARCFSRALETGKRIRTETAISHGNVSVASLACDLALHIFGEFDQRTALLLGAGEVGEQVVEALNRAGARIEICNRSIDRALALGGKYNAPVVSSETLDEALERVDVLIASASTNEFILGEAKIRKCMKARHGKPLFIVDIGVPRNVEPKAGDIDNVFIYDLDDLQNLSEANLATRKKEAKKAELIVGEEVEAFEAWRKSLELTPAIVALQSHVQTIADEELARALARMPNLSEQERAALQDSVRRLANRVLHNPLTRLKAAKAGELEFFVDALQQLFELDTKLRLEVKKSTEKVAEPSALLPHKEASK